jgi:hypothetical protein
MNEPLTDSQVVDLIARYFGGRRDDRDKNVAAMNLFGRRFPEVLDYLRQREAYYL